MVQGLVGHNPEYLLIALANLCRSLAIPRSLKPLRNVSETLGEHFERVYRVFKWEFDSTFRELYISTWWRYNHPQAANNLKHLDEGYHSFFIEGCPDLSWTSQEQVGEIYLNQSRTSPGGVPPLLANSKTSAI
jgi:hypothetical protein